MALNKERYHLVGTPRVFCSVVEYLKAIGIPHRTWNTYQSENIYNTIGNSVWDGNPANVKSRTIEDSTLTMGNYALSDVITFADKFVEGGSPLEIENEISEDLGKLIRNVNYFGIMSQDISSIGGNEFELGQTNQSFTHEAIIGSEIGLGTYLAKITETVEHTSYINDSIIINHYYSSDPINQIINLSGFQVGYYYDFPHSPNMSVSVSYSFDGIKRQKTISGSDITQINYLKPNWGKYAPFTNTINDQDFTDVGLKGRRIIDMSFDYISESDMFPKNIHQNTFVQDFYDDSGNYSGHAFDTQDHNANILGNYLNLTLGGNLTHILQLDTNANDFVLVKLDGSATEITQKSPKLYSCRLRFVEQF